MAAEAPRSPGRRRLLIGLAAAGGLAAVGGAGAVILGGRKPTEVVAASPTPPADVTASRNPATATASPTKAPTPKPTENPVELAIKNGRLELKGEKDWEKYFIAISPEEAEELLQKSNSGTVTESNYRYLLDFDPRKSPNLILQNFEFKTPTATRKFLGAKNIVIGTTFYAQFSGTANISGDIETIGASVEKTNREFVAVTLRREKNEFSIALDKATPVKIGEPLTILNNTNTLQAYEGGYQAVMGFSQKSKPITNGFLENLLLKNGKIAFIAQN